MNESGCSVRSRAKSGAAVLLALGFLLVFLDAIAVTWYLWKLPASSFGQLDKVLRGLGGWVSAALGFLGIKHTIDKPQGWQLAAGTIVVAASVLVWFLLLPVHSLRLTVEDMNGPMEGATATIAGEGQPRGRESDSHGSLGVNSLAAAPYHVVVARQGYVSKPRIFEFLDVVLPGVSVPLKLERESGVLVISSKPNGAAVTVDGQPHGATPTEVLLISGRHQVKLSREGCRPLEFPVEMAGGRRTEQRDLVCARMSQFAGVDAAGWRRGEYRRRPSGKRAADRCGRQAHRHRPSGRQDADPEGLDSPADRGDLRHEAAAVRTLPQIVAGLVLCAAGVSQALSQQPSAPPPAKPAPETSGPGAKRIGLVVGDPVAADKAIGGFQGFLPALIRTGLLRGVGRNHGIELFTLLEKDQHFQLDEQISEDERRGATLRPATAAKLTSNKMNYFIFLTYKPVDDQHIKLVGQLAKIGPGGTVGGPSELTVVNSQNPELTEFGQKLYVDILHEEQPGYVPPSFSLVFCSSGSGGADTAEADFVRSNLQQSFAQERLLLVDHFRERTCADSELGSAEEILVRCKNHSRMVRVELWYRDDKIGVSVLVVVSLDQFLQDPNWHQNMEALIQGLRQSYGNWTPPE